MKFKKILVIEDDGTSRTVIKNQLEQAKFQVDTAVNAKEGISKSQSGDYDLILLDLNLPDAYGLEISNHLYQPFVAMTSTVSPDIIEISKEMGAVAFIQKPFKIFDVLDVIQNAIEKGAKIYAKKMKDNTLKHLSQNNLKGETQQQKNENILIAIGCIIADLKVNQREAFNRIKNTADQSGVSIEIVAQRVVKQYETIAASAQ